MTVDYTDYLESGFKIFPLHTIENGACTCGKEDCQAIGKHPKSSAWQHTPFYDETQLAYLEDFEGLFNGNQLLDHFGVLVDDHLIVDVDGRNGGFESAEKLKEIREKCGFIVRTGSQNGEHWYFKLPKGFSENLAQNLKEFKGIDFKSSGFVVGCYSLHASGFRYEAEKGKPSETTEAPKELLDLLIRKKSDSFSIDSEKLSKEEVTEALLTIKPEGKIAYDEWISVGMALHHATEGSAEGQSLWEYWTLNNLNRSDVESIQNHWNSFGKNENPITQGTLLHMAAEYGYVRPVTFVDDTDWGDVEIDGQNPSGKHDLKNPPGLVGRITRWINSRSIFPREKLAVAAALQIVSNAAGLNYIVDETMTNINLITLGIAGSRTGKGMIKKCMDEVHQELGLSIATYGKFKSTQELIRNALYHQPIYYIYDEFGKQLEKLANASRSGAHYLEDLLAEIMAIYSEANGTHRTSGDVKREILELIDKQIAAEFKKLDLDEGENVSDYLKNNPESKLEALYQMRNQAETGLANPYLTFFGLTEPTSFQNALSKDKWLLTGGFLGRALIFEETNNVPEKKDIANISRDSLHMQDMAILLDLVLCGYSKPENEAGRIARRGEWRLIKWTDSAREFLKQIEFFWKEKALAEQEYGSELEGQALGATELTIKIAGVLAAETKLITREFLEWAHELAKEVTLDKITQARADGKIGSKDMQEKGEGMLDKIMHVISRDPYCASYITLGTLKNRVRGGFSDSQMMQAVRHLEAKKAVRVEEAESKSGRKTIKIYLNSLQ